MKLLQTLFLLVMVMASAMAARNVNEQSIYDENRPTISGRNLFETSLTEVSIDARNNGKPETGLHFYERMPIPHPRANELNN